MADGSREEDDSRRERDQNRRGDDDRDSNGSSQDEGSARSGHSMHLTGRYQRSDRAKRAIRPQLQTAKGNKRRPVRSGRVTKTKRRKYTRRQTTHRRRSRSSGYRQERTDQRRTREDPVKKEQRHPEPNAEQAREQARERSRSRQDSMYSRMSRSPCSEYSFCSKCGHRCEHTLHIASSNEGQAASNKR